MSTTTPTFVLNLVSHKIAVYQTDAQAQTAATSGDFIVIYGPEDLEHLSGPQLVAFFNLTADFLKLAQVKRFADRQSGAKRLWANLLDFAKKVEPEAPKSKPGRKPAEPKPAKAPRAIGVVNLAPKAPIRACREGTKQAQMVDLLSDQLGASMAELRNALSQGGKPWQDVTIKSGLNWDLNKIKGYGIRTEFQDGYDRWLAYDWDSMEDFPMNAAIEQATGRTDVAHPDEFTADEKAKIREAAAALGYQFHKTVPVYFLVYPAGQTGPVPHEPKKGK